MKKVAFIFPGQGSQSVGMGKPFFDENETIQTQFQKADALLDTPLTTYMFEGPEETLTKTEHTQPALLLTSTAIASLLNEAGVKPAMVAGHSLGEYSALVAAGALTQEDALQLVQTRGRLMEQAVPDGQGAMAAVLGLEVEQIEEVLQQVRDNGVVVEVANYNCPGQIVISGSQEGVQQASEQLKEQGAKRVMQLNVSGPFHSSLMKPASEQLEQALEQASIKDAEVPVYANVTAAPVQSSSDLESLLVQQLYSPVRFHETLQNMMDEGIEAFVEVGNGKVLSGLVRKVNRRMKTFAIQDPESLQQFIDWYKEDEA
ncbi:malonyl CoA-ACP transacylase [Pontibacillus halophilus JSM 076056 = DSM 19796]|uniref:Malonyl CoA-acyl carrier protein transacylase n=1 Tax=Pontibacillus halophilus JSM 076056 = DSM 19796 TaxID=1385510 RepID=A0A0A5GPV5_9BACI|nr:ACP S-malonyltransferase [Pontibacillus halophilus]KGX93200.1 malonyl CoA-ACP transacylase [Pontibacillus halophilus JSM 076056 = DSM 19796]